MELLFGTAGVPLSSEKRDSISGIKRINELGLECMELEFVRGVKMGEALAMEVREASSSLGIALSVHAPYFINLNSPEKEKVKASMRRIFESAKIGYICGAKNVVFHPGYYHADKMPEVYKRIKESLREILHDLKNEGIEAILRPETTGKHSQFGTIEEILNLCQEMEGISPCIDFAHIHARTQKYNSFEEFSEILSKVEDSLGRDALEDIQVHVSGIAFGKKGEKNHLNLKDSDFKYSDLLLALKEFGAKGQVICESPNLEEDALLLQEAYK